MNWVESLRQASREVEPCWNAVRLNPSLSPFPSVSFNGYLRRRVLRWTRIPRSFPAQTPALVSISSTSLNQEHITDALAKSEDNGATLDFSHRNLTDVGEYGAEELTAIGREDHVEDESSVAR